MTPCTELSCARFALHYIVVAYTVMHRSRHAERLCFVRRLRRIILGRATDSVHHHAQLWGVGHTLSRGGQRNDAIRHAAVPCRCAHCLIARSPSKGF